MEQITTFDGKKWRLEEIKNSLKEDAFYYGYLGRNALSSTALKQILTDFDAFLIKLFSVDNEKESQALRDGYLIHLAVLEPHRLKELTIVEKTKASKDFKELVAEFGSKKIFTRAEFERCTKIANYVKADFEAFDLFYGASYEVAEIKEIYGLPIRAKADAIKVLDGKKIGLDLKTIRSIADVEDALDWYKYKLQGSLYKRIFNLDEFIFIFVDKTTGEINIRPQTKEEFEEGDEQIKLAINIFKKWQRQQIKE